MFINWQWAYPQLLIIILAVIPLGYWLDRFFIKQYNRKRIRYAGLDWLPRLWPQQGMKAVKLIGYLWISILVLLIVALARPQGNPETITLEQPARAGYMIIDHSKSMNVMDAEGSRFETAKLIARKILFSLNADRIGLIAFEKDARQLCPVTSDKNALKLALDYTAPDQLNQPGSDPFNAVRLAIKKLSEWSDEDKYIILLSDGESHGLNEWEQIGQEARQVNIKLITIGIGSKQGGLIPEGTDLWGNAKVKRFKGKKVISKLHNQGLMDAARSSAGRYFYWQQPLMVKKIIGFLDQLEKSSMATTVTIYQERGFSFIIIAILLLLAEPLLYRLMRQVLLW